jgi:hypothetical protein
MTKKDYLDDISEIKNLMNKSTKFLSLSGLSGILAGIYALLGAGAAYFLLFTKVPSTKYDQAKTVVYLHDYKFVWILIILAIVALLSLITAYILSYKKAKKQGESMWNAAAMRLLFNFSIPLITGGLYILIKLKSQHYGLTAALMLIFYGLALVNASKYTYSNIRYLGFAQIILGLICAALPGYGFWFWILGFGILHIVYGSLMYRLEKH